EWSLLHHKRVILALGKIGWDAALSLAQRNGCVVRKPRAAFGHGAVLKLCDDDLHVVGSYHVSQQNTFTGKLTERMFDRVIRKCIELTREARVKSRPALPLRPGREVRLEAEGLAPASAGQDRSA